MYTTVQKVFPDKHRSSLIVGWWLHGSAQPQNMTPYVPLLLSCAAPDVRPINNSLRVESVDVHGGRLSVTLFFEVSRTGCPQIRDSEGYNERS